MFAWAAPLSRPSTGIETSLGNRTIEGAGASGKRTTWTIPAGRIGNENAIEIVSERW